MRKTASAARGATDCLEMGTQPQAQAQTQTQTEAKVIQLERYRAERIDASVSAVRHRLIELQRARIQAELSAGRLLRELAALQRELRDCRARLIQCGVID
ncbi:hypothetical protein [Halochromatium salexigens]|uniref:Uncharacterized protein n=1 Tax=Halochromatium salexigens TaxID=49447 RepID=A0AAJ0UFB1_HALSE|nr:hypothetical protein [Halochromatium salexigens]MBK5929840.1 hypothetical protein [Halochromatium salexigens]